MGEPGTGKSCLIKRYCEGRLCQYIPEYISTIGIGYGVKTIENEFGEVKVTFWDVAGDQVYFDIRNEFYKDTHGAILVYDVSNRSTFSALEKWQESFSYCQNDCVVFLKANKTDLEPRTVSTKEGQLMAGKMKFSCDANKGTPTFAVMESVMSAV
ncbi:DnaJ sub C member 27 [Borealophlyctis nickersoniae]|nr:DnaJ sub C member 27 [Borealophlyctis nickersoniae]